MKFVKMQATGNDFVLVNARRIKRDWAKLAVAMCHRRFGVGADGLLLLQSSKIADFRMRVFNPDGSEAEACGNGLRCFAKYVAERWLEAGQTEILIETLAGVRKAHPEFRDGKVAGVEVTMGIPRFAASEIPVIAQDGKELDIIIALDYPVPSLHRNLRLLCVSMGNPHAVSFLEEPVEDFPLAEIGPQAEHYSAFPKRVNFEIVNVLDRQHLKVRVWERGAGETLSCGSGACAVAVVAQLKGLIDQAVSVNLPGGDLTISWNGKGEIRLSGPAVQVFVGDWNE